MTKRLLGALLAALMVFSSVSCASQNDSDSLSAETATEVKNTEPSKQEQTETAPLVQTEEQTETVPEEKPIYNHKVDDPLTPERIAAIPIAREGMTSEELRQICVDYVKLSVSFQWLPSKGFEYRAASDQRAFVEFFQGKLHGGIPYINVASGNLYRIMEFYDTETGILDLEWLVENPDYFGTACSGTTGWGWARVVNSAVCMWTANLNASHGLVPVGPYTYDLSTNRFGEDFKEDCKDIAKRNGSQVMYESYALSKKADCFVNNGHVRMNGEDPVVVRKEDGTIDGEKSYIVQVEQGLYTNGEYHKRVTSDGTEYVIQGNDGKRGDGSDYFFTFEELFKSGYLPHTFKEFLGTDPIEPGEASIGITDESIAVETLRGALLTANYAISDVFFVLREPDGTLVSEHVFRMDRHYSKKVKLKDGLPMAPLWMNRGKGYTISLEVQLGNGERVTAYSGILA